MSWLWETERDERPRSSGLRLVLLGGLAPLVVIGAVAGVMLASPGATGGAGVAAEVSDARLRSASRCVALVVPDRGSGRTGRPAPV